MTDKFNIWISVYEKLPNPMEVVWIYWRGKEVLLGYKIIEEVESPADEGWYSLEDDKVKWTKYWMPLKKPQRPE